ncbi:hypothetical protein ACFV7Q_32695 [Streptomyces sp. NPDC059851]|uniref:nSTAND1 domain-containing NTPase n=1 Tax=Streptomyces sp. NPDC059851 TaxID=3346971 RepID=UPI00365B3110
MRGLPLLSHALLSTWERDRGSVLTTADCRVGDGTFAAVSASAEEAYAALSESRRALVIDAIASKYHAGTP